MLEMKHITRYYLNAFVSEGFLTRGTFPTLSASRSLLRDLSTLILHGKLLPAGAYVLNKDTSALRCEI